MATPSCCHNCPHPPMHNLSYPNTTAPTPQHCTSSSPQPYTSSPSKPCIHGASLCSISRLCSYWNVLQTLTLLINTESGWITGSHLINSSRSTNDICRIFLHVDLKWILWWYFTCIIPSHLSLIQFFGICVIQFFTVHCRVVYFFTVHCRVVLIVSGSTETATFCTSNVAADVYICV